MQPRATKEAPVSQRFSLNVDARATTSMSINRTDIAPSGSGEPPSDLSPGDRCVGGAIEKQ